MFNIHLLFCDNQNSLIHKLNLDASTIEFVKSLRVEVRNHLRENLPNALRAITEIESPSSPKFFTQGSFRYKTLNYPSHLPPQQADIDDGCYLPTEDWRGEYTSSPKLASKDFFRAVEETLDPLCKKRQWTLEKKTTCVRIIVSPLIHIDIPLYAIPEEEYKKLLEARALAADGWFADSAPKKWEDLPVDSVMLAHRKEDWVKSDPRQIVKWFNDQTAKHGEQLRRIVRYLKAFRDYQWKSGGPSSLLLMVMASNVFEFSKDRDDLALLNVCSKIPEMLRGNIYNPVDHDENLIERLSDREGTIKRFQALYTALDKAINGTSAQQSIDELRTQFGERIPNDTGLVTVVNLSESISSSPKITTVSAALIERTRAG